MESARRCEVCRRIVHGEAGNACPYCGGARLSRIADTAAHASRLHPPVFKLALVFCCGLAGMQVAAIGMGMASPPAGHGAPLWHLNLLVAIGMALYFALRRGEGDFRALFVTAFCIFILSEALGILSRAYGIGALHNLSGVFRHALLVFSSLALTAGAADGLGHTRHERVMLGASGGFLFLSALHLLLEFLKSENERVEDVASALVALAVAFFAAWTLWMERRERAAAPKSSAALEAVRAEKLLTPEEEKKV